MGKQPAFFMSEWEIFQKEHPERFERKKGTSTRKKSSPKVYDCSTCGLSEKCRSPKIGRFGEGRKKILIVGQCPGGLEDIKGRNFVGDTGKFLRRSCGYLDIDLDIDCERANIVRCYPGKDGRGKDKDITKEQIKCCISNLEKDIQEVQPKLIICLGTPAIQTILKSPAFSSSPKAGVVHGKVFPYHKYNCWVGCSYHPSFFLHRKNKKDVPDDEIIFHYDLANIISYLDEPLPQPLTSEGNECITDIDEAVAILEHYCNSEKPVSFDFETNMLDSFQAGAELKSISITDEVESASFIPIGLKGIFNEEEQTRIAIAMKNFLKSDAPKICQNYYMEEMWGRCIFGQSMNNFIHDTMVTAHVINCHPRTTGLAYQAFEMTGHEYKHMIDVTKLDDEPLEKTCDYNCWDCRYPIMSYKRQKSLLPGNLGKFNEFFRKSLVTLANYKYRGIQIDEKALVAVEKDFGSEMEEYQRTVEESNAVIQYNESNEEPFKITSSAHIGKVLYDICGVPITKKRKTPSGKGCTRKEVFAEILSTTKNDMVRRILTSISAYRRCRKVLERTAEYRRLVDPNWRIHPTFSLNVTRSYRSASDGPNIQNVFKHNERQKTFRRCIVPGEGYIFLEPDYSGAEICVAAMVSGDPVLTKQIIAGINIHRMWASRILSLPEEKITKALRNECKAGFFFASIYGAFPETITYALGVDRDHAIKVQNEFWDEYSYIKEWQLKVIHDYLKNGYVELVTGARRPGPLSINKIYNTPIQGPSYHLLQDAGNRIDDELVKREFKSFANAEIHDAIILNTHVDEVEEVIDLGESIMCSKRFDWQRDVPMSVEWDVGVKNWYEMTGL
jgi:uracil-DNA glycosylase family 4